MLLRATEIRSFQFPRDFGYHCDFRTEWWYLCGRLTSANGHEWGYHFTIFRRSLERWRELALVGLGIFSKTLRQHPLFRRYLAEMLESQDSQRISVDGYVGHLAVTSITDGDFVFFERGGTSLFNIAGADQNILNVWVKDWRLGQKDGKMQLSAHREGVSLDLTLSPRKPPVFHGVQGLSLKGSDHGQASYHYSLTSLKTAGTLLWRETTYEVAGSSLMDREYGTAMFPRSVKGWDWFGLTLSNEHELMICVINNIDGSVAQTSSGIMVMPDGTSRVFNSDSFRITGIAFWMNLSGVCYPTGWVISLESLEIFLTIQAIIQEQELVSSTSTTVDYWEGPVNVQGTFAGATVEGFGHVELVGYAQPIGGKF